MSVVAAAIIGSAVVGGASSYFGAKEQEKGAKRAADSQERIANENLAFQRETEETQRADFEPWREAGANALKQIQEGIDSGAFEVGKIDVTQDPGYQFRMDQGIKALDSSAASRGRLLSGAQQKGLTDYSQGVASQEYANAYAREANDKARRYNMLNSLNSQGQASAARQAGATAQMGQTSGNILSNLGNAQAQSQIAQGQARAGAYQNMAQAANQGAQNWLTYNALGNGSTNSLGGMGTGNSSYNPMGGGY